MSSQYPSDPHLRRLTAAAVCLTLCFCVPTFAQESRDPGLGELPDYAKVLRTTDADGPPQVLLSTNGLPHILITGYWPPTNEMLRQFSVTLNENGWVGENWEGRGYNIYAYFPEFPGQSEPSWGKGEGDFEVDYQDTSNDWWPLVEAISPIAIVTFSRAGNDLDWELEGGNRTYRSESPYPYWTNDYLDPKKPTPELPSYNETPGFERSSSQPMEAMVQAVNTQLPALNAYATTVDTGKFLSNYIGYHGNWWHDLHADKADPQWNIAAGHIHVGYGMTLQQAETATEITLRVLTDHLDARRGLLADQDGDGDVDLDDWARVAACANGPAESEPPVDCPLAWFTNADLDADNDVDLVDFAAVVSALTP